MKPLAVDLFCGLGGWSDGLLASGYDVIGFDIERHEYGEHRYPAQLVVQDVTTLHGSQFRSAALIVASPPCQAYSWRAMPWKAAKAAPPPDNTLFEACFRIQREACAAAGRHIPLVVENVRGAQKWVGRARWNFGSYYLWGDVPALMPMAITRRLPIDPYEHAGHGCTLSAVMVGGGIKGAHGTPKSHWTNPAERDVRPREGFKSTGLNWSDQSRRGQDFTRVAGRQAAEGRKGTGSGADWFDGNPCQLSSRSSKRKAASALIAKIPFTLACHVAQAWHPQRVA